MTSSTAATAGDASAKNSAKNSGRGSSNKSAKVPRPVGLDESKWYYYDRDDKLFGPFPTEAMKVWNAKGQFGEDLWARPPLFWYDTILHAAPQDANAVGFAPLGELFSSLDKEMWFEYKYFKNTLMTNPIKLHCVLEKYKTRKFPQPQAEQFSLVSPLTTPGFTINGAEANRPLVSERPLNMTAGEVGRVSAGSTVPLGGFNVVGSQSNANMSVKVRGSATSGRASQGMGRKPAGHGELNANLPGKPDNVVAIRKSGATAADQVHVAAVNFQP